MLVGATGFEPVLVHFLQPAILLHFFETLDFTAHFIVCMCNKIGFNSTHYIPMQHEMQHENFMKVIQYSRQMGTCREFFYHVHGFLYRVV